MAKTHIIYIALHSSASHHRYELSKYVLFHRIHTFTIAQSDQVGPHLCLSYHCRMLGEFSKLPSASILSNILSGSPQCWKVAINGYLLDVSELSNTVDCVHVSHIIISAGLTTSCSFISVWVLYNHINLILFICLLLSSTNTGDIYSYCMTTID
jgi:hypothetical protein